MNRRNRVIGTYMRASTALALSDDPDDRTLARDTERYAARLTELMTERAQIASNVSQDRSEGLTRGKGPALDRHGKDLGQEPPKGPDKGRGDRER